MILDRHYARSIIVLTLEALITGIFTFESPKNAPRNGKVISFIRFHIFYATPSTDSTLPAYATPSACIWLDICYTWSMDKPPLEFQSFFTTAIPINFRDHKDHKNHQQQLLSPNITFPYRKPDQVSPSITDITTTCRLPSQPQVPPSPQRAFS